MGTKLQKSLSKKTKNSTNTAYPYELPHLIDSKFHPDKPSVINFYIWNVDRKAKQRKRVAVSEGKTWFTREKKVNEEITRITKMLEAGAIAYDKTPPMPAVNKMVELTSLTIDKAIELYLAFKRNSLKINSYKTYVKHLKMFWDWIVEQKLTYLSIDMVSRSHAFDFCDQLITEKKLSNKTHNSTKANVATFFDYYLEREAIKSNPFAKMRKLREKSGSHIPVAAADVPIIKAHLLTTKQNQLWLHINVIYYLALRNRHEARLLKIGDIGKRSVKVIAENAKNSDAEFVMIPPPLEQLIEELKLREYPPHFYVFSYNEVPGIEPVSSNYFYARHQKVLKKLDLSKKGYTLYGWKHTGAINLYLATKDIKLIQRQCRHKDILTTDKYLRDLGMFLNDDELNDFPAI